MNCLKPEQRIQIVKIYFDKNKSLRKVPRVFFGVGNDFSRFISSFLRDRSIRVVVDGVSSDEHRLNAGVPQGSVLSPSLFLIFIDDLLCRTVNPIYSFADDSSLCHSYSFDHRPSLQEIDDKRRFMDETLSQDLLGISEWGRIVVSQAIHRSNRVVDFYERYGY